MTRLVREEVRQRAGGRCEYCGLPEVVVPVALHVEHVRSRQHGGRDDLSNLALACDRCNLYKGPNLTAIDPQTDRPVGLFNPRDDRWADHFRQDGAALVGLTPAGRATASLLQFNAPARMRLRASLLKERL